MAVDRPDWQSATTVATSAIQKARIPYVQNGVAVTLVALDTGAVEVGFDTGAPIAAYAGVANFQLTITGHTSGIVYLNRTFDVGVTRVQGSVPIDSRDTSVDVLYTGPQNVIPVPQAVISEIIAATAVFGFGGTFDVSDRAGRLLGIIASIAAAVDVSDRAARLLGVVNSITNAVDISDRAARLLGVVASITAAVDISDRAGRLLGTVSPVAASVWDVSDRALRSLGIVSSQPLDGARATYSAGGNTAVATAATDFVTISASASKKVRILRVEVSGRATAALLNLLTLQKRSTLDTGGTSTTVAGLPHEATDPAATATVTVYTVNPAALGTFVGVARTRRFLTAITTATTGAQDVVEWLFGNRPGKGLVLAAAATTQYCLNLAAVNGAGTVIDWSIEWTEE